MRIALVPIIAVIAALGLAACGGGGGSTTGANPEPPPTTTPPPQQPPPPPPPAPSPQLTTVRIVVRDGKVVGGLHRTTVQQGENVAIVVRSDVADEVHLHGYDKSVDVTPGKPARLAFVASIPGRFEVELEDRGFQIADIEVRP
jgi:hypothetical protein